jgi:hypothetical protein
MEISYGKPLDGKKPKARVIYNTLKRILKWRMNMDGE